MSIQEAIQFMNELELTPTQAKIAELVIKEIKNRLSFLNHVGLSYLTLDRLASTLSGGSATYSLGNTDWITFNWGYVCFR